MKNDYRIELACFFAEKVIDYWSSEPSPFFLENFMDDSIPGNFHVWNAKMDGFIRCLTFWGLLEDPNSTSSPNIPTNASPPPDTQRISMVCPSALSHRWVLRIDEQPDVPVLLPITDFSLPRHTRYTIYRYMFFVGHFLSMVCVCFSWRGTCVGWLVC